MERRLNILLSAYACEPGKGSEPEVGWQWARHLARLHNVTVLTRSNNEANIRQELDALPENERPRFVYHDLGGFAKWAKKRLCGNQLYYRRWQSSARSLVACLVGEQSFDVLHHLTFAGFRVHPAVFGHGVPVVWGPVGGMEAPPAGLLPWRHPAALVAELVRLWHNAWQQKTGMLLRRARQAAHLCASTHEMAAALAPAGVPLSVEPAIGLHLDSVVARPPSPSGRLRLLYVGNLLALKGLDLAIEALAASRADATLTLIGDGPFAPALARLAARLGIKDRVLFPGRLPRLEVLKTYAAYDAFVFPSLHDSGGFALIEAMAAGLPPVVLRLGGPGVAVTPECGFAIAPTGRASAVAGMAAAFRALATDPALRARLGAAARSRIADDYAWRAKAERMTKIYKNLLASQA
jgi:glycosyltransferase involved in cell wall biosynthesis